LEGGEEGKLEQGRVVKSKANGSAAASGEHRVLLLPLLHVLNPALGISCEAFLLGARTMA